MSESFVKLAHLAVVISVIAFLGITLGGCKKDVRFALERMPKHYRACAEKVVKVPEGPLTVRDLQALTIELRKSELRQNRCLRGAIEWADAQWTAYNKFYGGK